MADTKLTGVDTEIVFVTLLVFLLIETPVPDNIPSPLITVLAGGLLVLMLSRRMAVQQGIHAHSKVMQASTHLLDACTYVALLFLIYVAVEGIVEFIGREVSLAAIYAISAPIIVVGLFLVSELIHRYALEEGSRIFEKRARKHRGSFLGVVLSKISTYVSQRTPHIEPTTRQAKLFEYATNAQDLGDGDPEQVLKSVRSFCIFVFAVFLWIVSAVLLITITRFVFEASWLILGLLFLTTTLVSGGVRLWYSRFGAVSIDGRNSYVSFLTDGVAYFLITITVLT